MLYEDSKKGGGEENVMMKHCRGGAAIVALHSPKRENGGETDFLSMTDLSQTREYKRKYVNVYPRQGGGALRLKGGREGPKHRPSPDIHSESSKRKKWKGSTFQRSNLTRGEGDGCGRLR